MNQGQHQTRKQLLQRIQALEARLKEDEQPTQKALALRAHALEAVTQGIVILDATRPDRPVVYVNPALERLTGIPAAQALGQPGAGFLAAHLGWPAPQPTPRALPDKLPWSGEVQYLHPDGKAWSAELALTAAPAAGTPHHIVGVLTDINERKHLATKLFQSQKLDAIGRLAGGIAHDFNNILSVILGYCELMPSLAELTGAQTEAVREMRQAAESAVRLTGQLLAFSRKQRLVPRVIDLNAVVRDMDALLHRLTGEDVELVQMLGPGLRPIMADPSQLEQVILNLAVNARDAMPRGGRLTLETTNVVLDQSYTWDRPEVHPGPYVRLTLTDTGTGMDTHTQAHLFEPFCTTKALGKGTGLGLATIYGIVKQSEGYIYVYSEPGRGTTFKVYLPAVEGPISPVPPPAAFTERTFQGTETVLLVEDAGGLRTLINTILSQNGYTVLNARNGAEAIQVAASHPAAIDLLVTDVVMPQLSGRAVAERLTAQRPALRVLYLLGYTDEAVHRHGLVEPEWPFLQKPFTPSNLLRKIRQVLDAPTGRE